MIFKTLLKSDTKKNDGKKISGFESRNTLYGILISNLIIFFTFWLMGQWWYYLAFWLLPLFTFFQLFLRIRNIAEHAGVKSENDFNNAFLGYRKDAHKNILDMISINVIMKERTPLYGNLKLFKTITKDCV